VEERGRAWKSVEERGRAWKGAAVLRWRRRRCPGAEAEAGDGGRRAAAIAREEGGERRLEVAAAVAVAALPRARRDGRLRSEISYFCSGKSVVSVSEAEQGEPAREAASSSLLLPPASTRFVRWSRGRAKATYRPDREIMTYRRPRGDDGHPVLPGAEAPSAVDRVRECH
jgi:hypothetical protein